MNISLEDTQKKLDKALKRNLEGQSKVAVIPSKPLESETLETTSETQTTD